MLLHKKEKKDYHHDAHRRMSYKEKIEYHYKKATPINLLGDGKKAK